MKRILKRLWKGIWIGFAVVGLVTLAGIWLATKALRQSGYASREVVLGADQPVYLVWHLKGEIAERAPMGGSLVRQWLRGEETGIYVPEVRQVLQQAARDGRVKGLFLYLHDFQASLADLEELKPILDAFKATGKPLAIWSSRYDLKGYLLASYAKHIAMAPGGDVSIPGPVIHLVYFKKLMDTLGLQFEILRVGKFKSLFEGFVENTPSEQTRHMYLSLESSLRQRMGEWIWAGRGDKAGSVENTTEWLNESLFTADQALAKGLVDELAYVDDVQAGFAKAWGGEAFNFADYSILSADLASKPLSVASKSLGMSTQEPGIALIELVGEIRPEVVGGVLDEKHLTPLRVAKELAWAKELDQVKGVVLRISSPGGEANAADRIWHDVKSLAEKKPVVVSMGSVAASGGYYIAAPAHKIIAHPTTLTGSIGVIAMLPRLAAAQEKYGVHMHTITQSHRRGWFGMTGELSEGDRLLLQVGIERIYDLFTKKVAEGRHLPLEKVLNIAEGRVWTGQQALEIGLVDALGDLDTAFREVKTLAGLNPEASVPVLRWLPKIHALRECFLSPQHMEACTGQEYMPGGVLTVMSYGVGSSLPLLEVLHRVVGQAASLPVWDTLHKPMALWLDAGWSF